MVDPNWGLLQNNSMNYLNYGMQLGRDAREAQDARGLKNALASYVTNPNDPQAIGKVAQYDPKAAMTLQDRATAQADADRKKQQETAMTLAKLFQGIPDEATYQQRLGVAKRMGIDVSAAPPNFDPKWVEENGLIMQTVAQNPESLSTFGKIAEDEGLKRGTPEYAARVKQLVVADGRKTLPFNPGGGVAVYDTQTGNTQVIVQPYQAQGQTSATPAPLVEPPGPNSRDGALPRPQTKEEYDRLPPGQRYYAPDGQVRVKGGGASSNAGSGFPVTPKPRAQTSGNFNSVNGADVVRRLFPRARVTSGYRGPNHPLSQANPKSWHARSVGAVDVAPIPGMTFEQYIAGLRAAGYKVIDERDEAKHPLPWTTGPNWHAVIGE